LRIFCSLTRHRQLSVETVEREPGRPRENGEIELRFAIDAPPRLRRDQLRR
jgi:hypothetical protein